MARFMPGQARTFLQSLLLFPVLWIVACCAVGEAPVSQDAGPTPSEDAGSDASDLPCGQDCSLIPTTLQCTVAVCNTGQYVGQLNTCVVVPSPKGTSCD